MPLELSLPSACSFGVRDGTSIGLTASCLVFVQLLIRQQPVVLSARMAFCTFGFAFGGGERRAEGDALEAQRALARGEASLSSSRAFATRNCPFGLWLAGFKPACFKEAPDGNSWLSSSLHAKLSRAVGASPALVCYSVTSRQQGSGATPGGEDDM